MQAVQRFLDALLPVPTVKRLDFRLQRIQVGVFVGCKILLNYMLDARQSCAGSYENRSVRIQAGFLRNIRNTQVLLQLQRAVIGLFNARKNLEQ